MWISNVFMENRILKRKKKSFQTTKHYKRERNQSQVETELPRVSSGTVLGEHLALTSARNSSAI